MRFQKGLSLVELLISVTLGLLLMTGVIQMFFTSKNTFSSQQGLSRVQETGRLAIDFISHDIRLAGFNGFNSLNVIHSTTDITNTVLPVNLFTNYVEPIAVVNQAQAAANGIAAIANTEVLVIRGGLFGNTIPVELATPSSFTAEGGPIVLNDCSNGTSPSINGLCASDTLVIASPTYASVFKPTSILSIGGKTLITFNSGVNGSALNPLFRFHSQITQYHNVVYYIGNSVSNGVTSLFQIIDNGTPIELLEGVSNMKITYSRFNTPGTYVSAATNNTNGTNSIIYDANNPVVSLRVELLVQSTEANVTDNSQQYTFNGQNFTSVDGRLRQVFTTTIALRNNLH